MTNEGNLDADKETEMRRLCDELTEIVRFACPNHPSGELFIHITGFNWKTPTSTACRAPLKECSVCHKHFPAPQFLKYGRVETLEIRIGSKHVQRPYMVIHDSSACAVCQPREPIPIYLDKRGTLRVRLAMHDASGAPYLQWYAPRKGPVGWYPFMAMGARRMKPTGNKLCLQPCADRS